jgi:omega-6 fatty acid desaturase (delta-12 desaturase)
LAFIVGSAIGLGWLGWSHWGTALGVAWMIFKVLVVPFLGFSFIIGSLVHVHHIQPDIHWWRRREWTKFKGQMEGTTILRAPRGLDFFFHWIMVHIPHHVDMRIPMYNLELAADAIKAEYPDVVHDEPLRFGDFVANTKQCKVYDFDGHEWLTYAQAAARPGSSKHAVVVPVVANETD